MKKFLQSLSNRCVIVLSICAGAILGLAGYIAYASNVTSYLTNDPSACTNCHVMSSYYATWSHSSHATRATCNDCHVPHPSVIAKYYFKAKDGLYHAAVFTAHAEPQVLRPRTASATVIMNNCIRCHAAEHGIREDRHGILCGYPERQRQGLLDLSHAGSAHEGEQPFVHTERHCSASRVEALGNGFLA